MRNKKRILLFGVFALGIFQSANLNAQCGYAAGLGCINTNYNNFGINSTALNNPITIEYDNFVSGFHSSIVRTYTGEFKVWGELMGYEGKGSSAHLYATQTIDSNNYPTLTGTVLKATMASRGSSNVEAVILTTTGLFAWGKRNTLLATAVTNSEQFEKIEDRIGSSGIAGANQYGLPNGITPTDVKMLFGTFRTLAIVTCDGKAFVLSQIEHNRANGIGNGNAYTWSQVNTAINTPLTNIVAIRGTRASLIAFTKDNHGAEKLYTWGNDTYLGDGSAATAQSFATQMENPEPSSNIKMIGGTSVSSLLSTDSSTYYVLYTNGNIYALGRNDNRQLGDWTTDKSKYWIQPRYGSTSGTPITNIAWMSPNEHDGSIHPSINVLTNDGQLVNWGANSSNMLGRGTGAANATQNPNDLGSPPGNLETTDLLTSVETAGHTTLISNQCEDNFGYVGHAGNGSATGSGTSNYSSFIYTTASIQICGATTTPSISILGTPTLATNGKICNNTAIQLTGLPAGGTFSISTGSAYGTLIDNILTFNNNTGSISVKYTVGTDCDVADSSIKIFETESCTLYEISGTVWHDENSNAVQDGSESGTNAEMPHVNSAPLWVNLIRDGGEIAYSKQVAPDGTYSFSTEDLSSYEIWLSNSELGSGISESFLSSTYFDLPSDWTNTGTNVNNTPNITNQIGRIQNVDISAGINSTGNNFGIRSENAILPVNIAYFTAKQNGNSVLLNWSTATERNSKGFEIEYNQNGKKWNKIGFVASKTKNSTNSEKLNYEFMHHEPANGSNYYRLKQIDLDGKYEYSIVKAVYFNNKATEIQLSPNPVVNDLKIYGLARECIIVVYNTMGQKLIVEETAGIGVKKLHLSSLNSGTYIVKIINKQGEVTTHKIVKQ